MAIFLSGVLIFFFIFWGLYFYNNSCTCPTHLLFLVFVFALVQHICYCLYLSLHLLNISATSCICLCRTNTRGMLPNNQCWHLWIELGRSVLQHWLNVHWCLCLQVCSAAVSIGWTKGTQLLLKAQTPINVWWAIPRDIRDILKNIFLYKYPKNGLISSLNVSRTNRTTLPNIFNHSSFLLKAIHCPDSTQWKLSRDMLLDDINPFLGYL